MKDHNEFWQRPVTDRLALELIPGEKPSLLVNQDGETVLKLGFSEARTLIEVLTVAVGELLILKKDPAALARVRKLLVEDVTLNGDQAEQPSEPATDGSEGHLRAQELIRRYKLGGRSFPSADLHEADLQGFDLREIDLAGADLTRANLRRTNLFQANLKEAKLVNANLEEAGLFQANLRGADLSEANLHQAYMSYADLVGANVMEEQLAQAKVLSGAVMPDGTKHNG
jgi:hypothetical protein